MQLHLIRNATMRLSYGGRLILADPFLAAKHAIESFGGISENPLIGLPCRPEEVIDGVEMVLLSHLHIDHFDPLAQKMLPKNLPVYCQPGDEERIGGHGFSDIHVIEEHTAWRGVEIRRTPGQHGTGEWAVKMGNVSGFILQAEGEPSVYWCGDTIWYPPVEEVIKKNQPDIIITHSSGAKFGDSDPIVMDAGQTVALCQAAPTALVVAIHMESLDHGSVSRGDLRAAADAAGISGDRLLILADGERLNF